MLLYTVFFTNKFSWYETTEDSYSRHYILALLLIMSGISADYYLSTNDIYQQLYVSSSCVIYKES